MRRLLASVLLLQALCVNFVHAAENLLELVVTRPFLEMHSGPGRGYPVIYVVGRDETVTVLYSRTDWYKVRAPRGQEGWARRSDLAQTVLASGEPAPIPPYPDFASHRWEVGAGYGVYNRQNMVTAYADFGLTESLDIEAVVQQALGTIDNRVIGSIGIRHTFIPNGSGSRPRPASAPPTNISWIKSPPHHASPTTRWPTSRWVPAASSHDDSCGVPTGATMSSSTVSTSTRTSKNGNSA
jgi:hypothetical protein